MNYYQVAVAAPIDRLYVYAHAEELAVGTRVEVPLRQSHKQGVVLANVSAPQELDAKGIAVKAIAQVWDLATPYFDAELLAMAHFASAYYCCPLGWVLAQMTPAYRRPPQATQSVVADRFLCIASAPPLTAAQQQALHQMRPQLPHKPVLLRGITGSGKTELYMQLIADLLGSDGQALVMIPEIALAGQVQRVLQQRFPEQVAIAHSGMTSKQRWNSYQQMRTGERRVLLGVRSSIFAPFKCLRLLVVDEEHDSSYKQDSNLSYHGRDLAIWRAKHRGAAIVLGSATPSLESWHNAHIGKYHRVELDTAVHRDADKRITVMQRNLTATTAELDSATHDYLLSNAVCDKIAATLQANKQIIIIVNRRGYARFLLDCRANEPVSCPNCSVSLTLHDTRKVLRCHYCDYRITLASFLHQRRREDYQVCGFGSQQVEHAVRDRFPAAEVERIDSDAMTSKVAFNSVLRRFRTQEVQILVGTQMLAKGHDFPAVALLVLLHADQMLWLPDFRAAERTYQLLVQAMGRAGRSNDRSEVVIETSRTDLPIIKLALAQDFHTFAQRELQFRTNFSYPPYVRLACLELYAKNPSALYRCAQRVEQLLAAAREHNVRGPCDPPIAKINNVYRQVLYFHARDVASLQQLLRTWLVKIQALLPNSVRVRVDVDPQMIL
ncbi:MAG: primosomal protein N' [Pseudomonadota bacterium]|nr:primosomal protein N' [Pseudomonadota bacterium]